MYFLDSDFCVKAMRQRESAIQLLESLPRHLVAVPSIVRAELYFGAENSDRVESELAKLAGFFEPYPTIPFDAGAAETYGEIRANLKRKGQLIGDHDMLIAATALSRQATLITRNVAEFQRVPGLRLLSWED
ncbi:MAG: type II toxin-antitoxin system VapC family toxin [Bryobacteraceae bacterium]|nr:type II toxin-antitoxin system VapC family toxin [Bryobacteraceae bacterium]